MPTRVEIADDVYAAQQVQIRIFRPLASPWPDGVKLGPDDGAGYNFSLAGVRQFTAAIYGELRKNPDYATVQTPNAMPADAFLEHDLLYQRRWIVADVADQLGVA